MRWVSLLALGLSLSVDVLTADVVHLKDGKTVEGRTEDLGDYVRVTSVSGSVIKFPKALIVKIERTQHPRDVYLERLGRLKADDLAGCLELARWCKEHDLDEEYGSLLEKAIAMDPDNAEAKSLLYEYNKFDRTIPINEDAAQRLRIEFGPSFKIYHTPHYRICHDCDEMFLQRRAQLFEKAYERFYRYFEEKGFSLAVIPDHLEAVLFDTREEFVAYVQSEQRRTAPPPGGYIPVGFAKSAGFYSSATNRVMFYNAINDEQYRAIRRKIYSIPFERLTKESKKRLVEYKNQLSLRAKTDQNVSVTVHEAVHQLTFNLGLLRSNAHNPAWVMEGIAMYFETASEGAWRGAGRLNRERLDLYRKVPQRPPLQVLLVNDSLFSTGNPNAIAVSYAAAWALTYYLLEEHPKEFVRYLHLLRQKKPDVAASPEERIHDFGSVFGEDLNLIASQCEAFLDKLQ